MELAARTSRPRVAVPNQGDGILQNAINSFRQVLTPEQLAEFNCIQSLPDTDAVLVFTAELDLRRQSQKGKSIASRLAPVLQAVHSFTGVIDTLVSSDPTIAALVWGSVKMTIQIILNAASYYEAFAELFVKLTTICPRFEQYQALFPTSTRLQVALCNFNASIIRCCQRVIQMPKSSSGWTSPLNPLNSSFWQSFQQSFEPNLKELREHSENVKEEIRLAQAESEHRNREIQSVERDEAEKSRRSLSRFMPHTRAQLDEMRRSQLIRDKEVERARKQNLLDSLSSHDYMKPFKQARQKRYPQSATWIFDTNEFKSWAKGQGSPLLWCSGKMGSGKTILTASVIDFLLTEKTKKNGKVTFFFSRFDESEALGAENSLRAIARQSINIQDISDDAEVSLEDIHTEQGDILKKLIQLLGLLLVQNQRTAWVVIDGIDEWPRDERHKLVQALSSILATGPDVRIFATSRDYPDSVTINAFPGLHRVLMNCSKAQEGMAQLVDQALQKCIDAEELLVNDKKLIDDIKKTLSENADGMILWVTLVLRDLCMQPNNERIRDAISLRNLPKSLTEVFNRALTRIISEGKEGITQAILPWIVAAKQPLSLPQLEECCLIRVLQEYSIRDRYVNGIHLIDSWFQGLVEVDHETRTVHLIHSSVQSFFLTTTRNPAFEGFYVNMEQADRHIGEVIVTYLNFNDFKTSLAKRNPALQVTSPEDICQQALSNEFRWLKNLFRRHGASTVNIDGTIVASTRTFRATFRDTMEMEYPFLSYASKYWLLHSSNFNPKHCQVWQVWRDMLLNGHGMTTSPVIEGHHQIRALTHWAISNRHSPVLYVIAMLDRPFGPLLRAISNYVIDENEIELLSLMVEGGGPCPDLMLSYQSCRAARSGRLESLKIVVEAGGTSSICVDGFERKYPLQEAIESGQVGAVELLLASGANPNPTNSNPSTPFPFPYLSLAAELNSPTSVQICQMLIKAGVDLDRVDRQGRTGLQTACVEGQKEVVTLLLSAGANPNICDGEGRTPLARAAEREHLDIIKLLIEAGAGTDEELDFQVFRLAMHRNSLELVEVLIKKGAGMNGLTGRDDTSPLALAAKQGLFKIMHTLLDAGAPVVDAESLLLSIPKDLQNCDEYNEISRRLYNSRG